MRRLACIAALALALPASALSENGVAENSAADHAHPGTATRGDEAVRYPVQFQRFISEMDRDMQKMMADMHRPGYTGNADVDFLAMMIPHHQGAVDMARLMLIHGRDPLTRKLAEEILASQTTEIAAMRARLEILRRAPDADPGAFPALSGTRGVRD
ncbi:DUF305 domain-containing protein [Thiobacillus denitrificans]|uniref:DUF305 domain-containing protein n=1 Tax=Thiobacillus denitrificans TaxID=36861 RepID=UPI000AC0482C|nr:DUF305 domain-containing protein [Thiobacillus denitrificans]